MRILIAEGARVPGQCSSDQGQSILSAHVTRESAKGKQAYIPVPCQYSWQHKAAFQTLVVMGPTAVAVANIIQLARTVVVRPSSNMEGAPKSGGCLKDQKPEKMEQQGFGMFVPITDTGAPS